MANKIAKITEYLVYLALASLVVIWFSINSASSDNVAVSATVSSSMVSCTTATDTINFLATLDNSTISSTTDAVTTMSSSGSIQITVYDTGSTSYGGGLVGPSGNAFIESPSSTFSATATLVAGQEMYGLQAATTSGTNVKISTRYNYASATSLLIGRIATDTVNPTVIASSSAAVSSEKVAATLKAAAAITTPGGAYTDTITFGCLGGI
ncbi:MAG: hypothetical protein A3A08_00010 [Candidatus Nealsonbacteria bacterium RIFCSPLOWO2_01_FULL_41_9]|uniref:Uncharacterized protein n=1 Tax=Candidatus Nealsonbacteria bacterium RIFCSPLOWO2_01_FULL_41_9 TaxID=1801671 RepID=A0A1G2ECM4_9BACT|nr:MAG: hypothetical protein A3A08_00010 [Candidatus Nealsonbacteria bacterium RIFCSPLOWO2_01_FULL_41_9]